MTVGLRTACRPIGQISERRSRHPPRSWHPRIRANGTHVSEADQAICIYSWIHAVDF